MRCPIVEYTPKVYIVFRRVTKNAVLKYNKERLERETGLKVSLFSVISKNLVGEIP